MNKLKRDNFLKAYPGIGFPACVSLNEAASEEKLALIGKKLKLDDHTNRLSLVRRLDALGEPRDGVNAKDEGFRVSHILSHAKIPLPEHVYVNWYRFDEIDELSFADLEKYFSDIWYPDLDDIDLFDDSLKWILSIAHHGQVKLFRP
jgi:hypothetical protein